MPKVSVIIPVYNVEPYLRECLDSVVNQTLQDIEIICIDDGSTDGSLAILKEYKKKDNRVKLIQQKNLYAGVARNNGMSIASGEYYVFLDSDDFFELDLIEKQYNQCKRYDADISLCGADKYDIKSKEFYATPWLLKMKSVPNKLPFNREMIGDNIFQLTTPSPWTKMFSAKFVKKHNLEFQNIQRANDAFFVLTALNLAERITVVDKVLVHYRVGMVTNLQANNIASPLDFCYALSAVKERLIREKIYSQVKRGFINDAMGQCEYNLRTLKGKENTGFVTLANEIKNKYLYEFEIADQEDTFFYDDKRYKTFWTQLLSIEPPKVSVIIPVYNVEKYLPKCLNSVVNQSLKEIEIICVNDGSTDNSMQILEEYKRRDYRIQLITQKNKGLSGARNTGASIANGEYIYFIDSDDYITENALEYLYDEVTENQLEIILFDGISFYENKELKNKYENIDCCYRSKEYGKVYTGQELYVKMRKDNTFRPMVWLQMINREYYVNKELSFYEGILHEDVLFTTQCILQAERVSHRKKTFYHYRRRTGAITSDSVSFAKVYGKFVSLINIIVFLQRNNFNAEVELYMRNYLQWLLNEARKEYASLPIIEKLKIDSLSLTEKFLFQIILTEDTNEILLNTYTDEELTINEKILLLQDEYAKEKDRADKYVKEFDNIVNSRSYKIGRTITWIPRKLRGGIQCYRDHGLNYTLKHGVKKLLRRIKYGDLFLGGYRCLRDNGVRYTVNNIKNRLKKYNYNWRQKKSGVTKNKRNLRIIISLTSFPKRIDTVHLAIESLLVQSMKPDLVILWLASEQFPNGEKSLPSELIELKKRGLTIRWCEDIKSYKKLIPALSQYPEDIIITVDDDLLYANDMVEKLYLSYQKYPKAISCMRVHLIQFDEQGNVLPYIEWKQENSDFIGIPRTDLFATTGAGTLFPPHIFEQEILNKEVFMKECAKADDIWVKVISLLNKTPVVLVDKQEKLQYIPGSQTQCLWHENVNEGGNDIQLAALLKRYNIEFNKFERDDMK